MLRFVSVFPLCNELIFEEKKRWSVFVWELSLSVPRFVASMFVFSSYIHTHKLGVCPCDERETYAQKVKLPEDGQVKPKYVAVDVISMLF
jgi:hypothetical protein